VRRGGFLFLSGQIPLDPATGQIVEGDISTQTRRVFDNLRAVVGAAGGSFDDIVRVGIYVTDLNDFAAVNAVMAENFQAPFPARSTIEVSGLPRGARVEVDAILAFD
jgi:reactive intermediate/imine deaminase